MRISRPCPVHSASHTAGGIAYPVRAARSFSPGGVERSPFTAPLQHLDLGSHCNIIPTYILPYSLGINKIQENYIIQTSCWESFWEMWEGLDSRPPSRDFRIISSPLRPNTVRLPGPELTTKGPIVLACSVVFRDQASPVETRYVIRTGARTCIRVRLHPG